MNELELQRSAGHLSHPKYRPDIDGLRALAVIAVIIFHAFPEWMRGGFVGVDVFFVISGFLISGIIIDSLERNTFSFAEFYGRRIRRIFPSLLVILCACFGVGWFVMVADEYAALGRHIAGGAGFLSNFIFLQEAGGYFDPDADTKPLLHLWSLGVEEQFYIVWPLVLWLAWKLRRSFLAVVCLIALVSFVLNIRETGANPDAAFYLPQTRFWELLAGAALAHVTLYRHRFAVLFDRRLSVIWAPLGALLLVAGFFLVNKADGFPGWQAVVPVLGTVMLILAGSDAWLNRTLLSGRVLVKLGLMSFPLYLWHWPLLSFTRIIEGDTPAYGVRVAAILLAFALAWLTWRFVEKPLRFGGHGRVKIAVLCVLMTAIGCAGYYSYQHKGLKNRLGSTPWFFGCEEVAAPELRARLANPDYIKKLRNDRDRALRKKTCHVQYRDQTFAEYLDASKGCLDLSRDKKNILILGDSHAEDMYVALAHAYPQHHLLQATGSYCSPDVQAAERPVCAAMIKHLVEFAGKNKLDTIILASRWKVIHHDRLREVVEALKKTGARIILVGPSQTYTSDVSKIIARCRPGERLADLSKKFTNPQSRRYNVELSRFAAEMNIEYFDKIALFCNADGSCPFFADNGELVGWDYGHLSRFGAHYLGRRMVERGMNF